MPDEPSSPLVSIVVVNYNGKKFLHDCFSALFCQTYVPLEIIMVDNASSDDSIAFIRRNFPPVVIIAETENRGFAGGTNAGIRQARGQFIVTLNNDTIVSPDFVEEIIKPMVNDPSVGVCGSKMVLPDGRINSTAICISRSCAAWDRGMGEPDSGQYDLTEEVFGACAGAALYRKSMLDEIGLFDEDFFLYMEDVDLAYRVHLAGWKCIYEPKARVVHIHGGTAGFKSDLSTYYGNRNIIWTVYKNWPARTILLCLPWLLVRNSADIFYYAKMGMLSTIVRAKKDSILGMIPMIKKRRTIRKTADPRVLEKWIHVWSVSGC
jgi:GT2 family glycosyltransferase